MTITIGTDYSGMESPIIALKELSIPHEHIFSSEIEPNAQLVIQEIFQPKTLYKDTLTRKQSSLPKHLDLYVAGFPCQAFSPLRFLFNIKHINPLVHFNECIETIKHCNPTVYILENVPLILSGEWGETVKKEVKLKGCHVSFLISNGQDYGSLQSRRRLFIVGLNDKIASGQLSEPPKIECIVTFEELLEHQPIRNTISENRSKLIHACVAKHPEKIFWSVHTVNSDFRNGKAGHKHVPTLTRNSRGIYWVPREIRTTVREMLRI